MNSLEELKETLEDANSGKTPGTDGVDKEFLTRFWSMIGKTIYYAQRTFIENEKLNEFLDSGLIKILQKGGTKGELIKDWKRKGPNNYLFQSVLEMKYLNKLKSILEKVGQL